MVLAACTLFLVVAGALVTSNDAGLSVPDWPLSYGKLMPPMRGGIFYEHGHRMVATTVGLLTIVLTIWLAVSEPRRWMRRLGVAALAAVVAQGILGGMTVLFMLPKPVSISHACLAELFFSTTVAIVVFTSPSWKSGPASLPGAGSPGIRLLAVALPLVTLCQVALGASYRHRLIGIVPHILGAATVMGFSMMVAILVLMHYRSYRPLDLAARTLLVLASCQVFLGIAAYMSRISVMESGVRPASMIVFSILHVAVGAMTMAASVVLALQILRNVRPPDSSEAGWFRPAGVYTATAVATPPPDNPLASATE